MEINFLKKVINIQIFSIKKCRLAVLAILLCLGLFNAELFGQAESAGKKFSQKLEWQSDDAAFEYKVEIKNLKTGKIEVVETENNWIEFSKASGKYEYRVTAIDFLGRESDVSQWQSFEIIKALQPAVESASVAAVDLPENLADGLKVNVNISNVKENTKVKLINQKNKKTVDGKLVLQNKGAEQVAVAVEFPAVEEGNWVMKITDASGLETETTAFEVRNPWPAIYKQREIERKEQEKLALQEKKQQEAAEKEAEKIKKEEEIAMEKQRLAEEALAKKEQEQKEKEELLAQQQEEKKRLLAERQKEDEDRKRIEEEKRQALAQKKEEALASKKEEKTKRKFKDIYVGMGPAAMYQLYDGTLFDYSSLPVQPSFMIDVSAFPIKFPFISFGFDVSTIGTVLFHEDEYLKIILPVGAVDISLAAKIKLIKNHLYLKTWAGGNLFFIYNKLQYQTYIYEREVKNGLYGYAGIQGGTSFIATPAAQSRFYFELGGDFTHEFIPDMPTGIVSPYIMLGARF